MFALTPTGTPLKLTVYETHPFSKLKDDLVAAAPLPLRVQPWFTSDAEPYATTRSFAEGQYKGLLVPAFVVVGAEVVGFVVVGAKVVGFVVVGAEVVGFVVVGAVVGAAVALGVVVGALVVVAGVVVDPELQALGLN